MYLNYEYEQLIIDSCKEMSILINVTSIKNKINKVIKALATTTILSKSTIMISMRLRDNELSQDRNFMFVLY